ncbi:hypothetical protein B0H12DRAFT_1100416 [Mycena haematopus]|nr:hypothetical protein B0H12DRAFT_1100416 [Mycena haematopus]
MVAALSTVAGIVGILVAGGAHYIINLVLDFIDNIAGDAIVVHAVVAQSGGREDISNVLLSLEAFLPVQLQISDLRRSASRGSQDFGSQSSM